MGNELASPIWGQKGIETNTVWYAEMYSHIRENYKKTLLTGVASSDLIEYSEFEDTLNLITTDHIYIPRFKPYPKGVPVIIEEIGVSHKQFGFEFDKADRLLRRMLAHSIKIGVEEGVARVGSAFLWQADEEHKDNLLINAEDYSLTLKFIKTLSPKLKAVFS